MVSQVKELSNRRQSTAQFGSQTFSSAATGNTELGCSAIPPVTEFSKRAIDIALSLALLALLSPVFLALAGAVRMSGRQILFRQWRVGRHGRLFKCLKYRTMTPDAEQKLEQLLRDHPELAAEWERSQKLKNDPRITRVGKFLRRTSLDELPQLWNVLRGDMSLVGPRPVIKSEIERYGRAARWYLQVRPGISGLWQVSGRSEVGYSRRIALDTYYVKNLNLALDLKIMLKTVWVVFAKMGAY